MITGSVDDPSVVGCASFRHVLMKSDVRRAIERINLRDGEPWLDEGRVSAVVSALGPLGLPEAP